uniref:RNA polymerase II C-terminal domain phosphatase-like n=1 Tax=Chenopodium quinoa TaxID=63459 RepID=A0A803L210_CHEQI
MSVVEISARNHCLMKKGIESEAHFPLAQGHNCPFEGQMIRMSVATDSPVNSLSSDDFLAILDAELDSASSDQSPDQDIDANEDNDAEIERIKRRKVSEIENGEEVQSSSSYVVAEEEIGLETWISRLRNADVRALLRRKKLYLVLDLDHTLLNSTRLEDINAEEEYLKGQTDSFQDISKGSLFRLDMMRMMTKLRPFVRTFLQEASNLFEMYIYTMGERPYAIEMAKLLDPGSVYFNSRVISQADCTQRHQKGLDVVLGQESAVLILDDTEAGSACVFSSIKFIAQLVWQKHKENLILMERYHYFSSSCRQFGFNCKSLSELKGDENEADGALATVLGVLKSIHEKFFDPENGDDFAARDVRQVLKQIRKEVLKDCKIVFSRVFSTKYQAANHHLWKMAEQLGAKCSIEVDSSVTHVVSTDAGTDKSRWALQHGKFLVHPRWLEAANYMWNRKSEDEFPTSVATDSPVNSLSSDDFLAILDAELDSASSDQSPDQDIDANEDNDVEIERIKRRKVSEIENGEEVQSSSSFVVAEEEIDEDVKDSCPHPGFLRDMCICCGKRMEDSAGVAFGYIHKDLRLGSDEISRLRNADVRALLRGKKLYLVLDLDQTLLNSTRLEDINAEEEYLKGQTDSFQGWSVYTLSVLLS